MATIKQTDGQKNTVNEDEQSSETPTEANSTPGSPDPWAVLDRLTRLIEAQAAGGQNNSAIEVLTKAVMRMTDAQVNTQHEIAAAQLKARRPSNEVIPEISVFNRRGRSPQLGNMDPMLHAATIKPPLKCVMMLPWIAEWESLTREEVQLLNLLESGQYVVKRSDRSKITMTVQIRYAENNVTPSMLFINHDTAFTKENFRLMPALSDILRQMLKQHDRDVSKRASSVLSDDEEEAMITLGEITVTT